jgi:intermembrane space import and assembly protein 40
VIEEKRRSQTRAAAAPTDAIPERSAELEQTAVLAPAEGGPEISSPGALEEEAGQQGAFDPETGEINWDCPCLGGMAHGPCGDEFKAAFSCFVYSKEEPKGMDCIDKFQYVTSYCHVYSIY